MKREKREDQEEYENPKEMVWDIFKTLMYMLIVATVCLLTLKYVGQRTVVIGDSMNNTFYDGDNLVVDKISYRFRDPNRFEVIVFPFMENGEEVRYIKRIIGLPGETIQIKDNSIYIDGELLEEDFGLEKIEYAGYAGSPVTLGDDEYFVLGDNRNHSKDSRELDQYGNPVVGVIHKSIIIGRAWVKVYPFKEFGFVH